MDGALDVPLVRPLVPDPDEAHEVLDVAAAHQEDAGTGDDGDCADGEGPAQVELAPAPRDRKRADCGERDPDRACERAREDEPEGAARSRHPREEALARACRPQREQGDPDRKRTSGERGEVVDAEERRLALERPLALELVHESGELQQSPGRRRGAPERDCPEQDVEVPAGAQKERHGQREDRVLDELRRRHEVRQEPVVGGPRERVDGGRDDHRQEERAGHPDRARRSERSEAVADPREDARHGHGEHGHVRELDPGARRPEPDVNLRLVLDVQEDQGDRQSEHDRTDGQGVRTIRRERPRPGDATRGHEAPRYPAASRSTGATRSAKCRVVSAPSTRARPAAPSLRASSSSLKMRSTASRSAGGSSGGTSRAVSPSAT